MDYARRLAQYQAAVEAEPADAANWRGLCRCAEALHLWKEVVNALDRLIGLTEDRSTLSRLQAKRADVTERGIGDFKTARAHFERAMQADPRWTWPYLALAMLDLRERRWNRAIAHANHGLELAGLEASERPWLLLVKAIAGQRVSVSMGPQSTFFRALRPAAGPDPSEAAFAEARGRLPDLTGMSAEAFLSDGAAAVAFVAERCPRPLLDAM